MIFAAQALCLAQDSDSASQDAYSFSVERGVAAVADGVSACLFSGPWARIVTEGLVTTPPDFDDSDSLLEWLGALRSTWADQVNLSNLNFFQRGKLTQYGPGATTFVWSEVTAIEDPLSPEDDGPITCSYRLKCFAIGDSCLFHVRDGRLLRSFPLERPEQFTLNPLTIDGLDIGQDDALELRNFEDQCFPDDLLLLCTDAIACWLLERVVNDVAIDWDGYWTINEEVWKEEIRALRESKPNALRSDDTTMLLLRVLPGTPLSPASEPDPTASLHGEETPPGEPPTQTAERSCDACDVSFEDPAEHRHPAIIASFDEDVAAIKAALNEGVEIESLEAEPIPECERGDG